MSDMRFWWRIQFQLQVKRGVALKTQRYHKKRMLAAKIADVASEFWKNCRSTVVKLSCAVMDGMFDHLTTLSTHPNPAARKLASDVPAGV